MIINTTQVEMVLSNKAIPGYSLEAETGVSRNTISKFRRGLVQLENIKLNTLMQIQKWIDEGNFNVSYDYSEMIEDLQLDIEEGDAEDYIYIVRGPFHEAIGTNPIVDYYCNPDEIEDGIVAEKARTSAVLSEMELFDRIF